jgi:hypothetical protein
METIEAAFKDMVRGLESGRFLKRLVDGLQKGRNSPQAAAREIMDRLIDKEGKR